MILLSELNEEQARNYTNSRQLWQALLRAQRRFDGYKGGMIWRNLRGKDRLIRIKPDNKQLSLGERTEVNEKKFRDFLMHKEDAKDQLKILKEKMDQQARVNKALRLGRVPLPAAKILRLLSMNEMLGTHIMVVGTYALYAYEAMAGVQVNSEVLATNDLDFMLDARRHLKLTSVKGEKGLMGILKKSDRSFVKIENVHYRAENKEGFMVDLIKPEPLPAWKEERDSLGGKEDLEASPIGGLQWLENAPRIDEIAIGEDGFPVPMSVPDPRAFSLYKYWLGSKAVNRAPIKKRRDLKQSNYTHEIVKKYLPYLIFEKDTLSSFPKSVRDMVPEGFWYS